MEAVSLNGGKGLNLYKRSADILLVVGEYTMSKKLLQQLLRSHDGFDFG